MSEEKEVKEILLERGTFQYTHVSPFKLNRVAQAERLRYIKEELGGVEPKPPTYTITHGGGLLPTGVELQKWEQSYDYTQGYIAELQDELSALKREYNELDRNAEIPPAVQARFVALHNALDKWAAYVETVENLGASILYKKRSAGLWLMFGQYMPEGDDWIKEQESIGIDTSEVPDDKQGRFIYWLETELVATQQEYTELILIVEGKDAAVREARKVTRAMFQHTLG